MSLKVFWMGYGGHSWMAEKLRNTIMDLGMELVTIHEHPHANIKWDLSTVYKELQKADIIIIPANFKTQPCKSNNRLTQAMALGKAVICDPLPAYLPILKNGINGLMTQTGSEQEYAVLLKLLKDNPELRKSTGQAAKKTAEDYTQEKMAISWIHALNNIDSKKEAIDVVIPTKNNIPYLKECVESFKNSTLDEYLYIIDNTADLENKDIEQLMINLNIPYEIREV